MAVTMFNNSPSRFALPPQAIADDSNMIPLINIVFLMLIFFMVAGTIAASDAAPFAAPHTSAATRSIVGEYQIILAADHVLWLEGQPLGNIESLAVVDWLLLERELAKAAGVIVKADADLPASLLDPLFERLRRSDIQSVQLAVQEAP